MLKIQSCLFYLASSPLFLFSHTDLSSVIAGDASLVQSPQLLEITASDRAIIEWNHFSISSGETVRFLQPSSESAVLNRVIGSNLSEIHGTLQANGVVYLINPQGVIVGENGLIDTASFLASTFDFSNEAFLKGGDLLISGEGEGSIVQLGTIRAKEGAIYLFAHEIQNKGPLQAKEGAVSMCCGHEILLKAKACPLLNIRPDRSALGILNEGTIEALDVYLQSDSLSQLALQQQGDITLTREGGKLLLSTSGGPLSIDTKAHLTAPAGTIDLHINPQSEDNNPLDLLGSLDVSGEVGGTIEIQAPKLLNCGTLKADGVSTGGTIVISVTETLIETQGAKLSANGSLKAGTISHEAQSFFSSGRYEAKGKTGGSISLLGDTITLAAAHISASGTDQGGQILIGGDFQGKNPAIRNAQTVHLTPSTSIQANGEQGGKIIVWSDGVTKNYAALSANTGGLIEVSGKEQLIHRGTAEAKGGQLLFDPQNITIDDVTGVYPQYSLVDPNPSSGSGFGTTILVLSTGNIVVTKPGDNFGGKTASGAVYLYNGATGALTSTLHGSSDSDQVGSTVVALTGNGNYVVISANWSNGSTSSVGAVTWGNGSTGVSGPVSASNSLIGSTASDGVGSAGVTALTNGNYVVRSPNWDRIDGGAAADVGAATWGNGMTGITGTVSVVNSLIGSTLSDQVSSSGVTILTNSNYIVASPSWSRVDPTAVAAVGAATWGSGTAGITGTVSVTNSLIGSTLSDQVGKSGVTALTNGNYVVRSPYWDRVNPTAVADVGAATWGWGNGTGITGTVSVANSLIGSRTSDLVSKSGVTALTNGHYVVSSSSWTRLNPSIVPGVGAATWGSGTAGITGTISTTNSLIGSTLNDNVSSTGIIALTNGNYVVSSPLWNRVNPSAVTNVGAVTWGWGNGTGITGTVSVDNSLIGSTLNDQVGSRLSGINRQGVNALPNGNYVVSSPYWDQVDPTAVADVGAVTWGSGTAGVTGTVSVTNSLIGSTLSDLLGLNSAGNGISVLTNGNYVVQSPYWDRVDGGALRNVGAVTWGWGNGTGITGTVSVDNSLIGSTVGDQLSYTEANGVVTLDNGNYVVRSPSWSRVDPTSVTAVGAATWGSGTAGITGTVSVTNSLIGSTENDSVSSQGIIALTNNNYVVNSPYWTQIDPSAVLAVGAVTWGSGTAGVTGTVSVTNSLIGSTASDGVGVLIMVGVHFTDYLTNGVVALANGDYAVGSSNWKEDGSSPAVGAVTYANGITGTTGTVSVKNSIIGSSASSNLQLPIDNTAVEDTFICNFIGDADIRIGLTSPTQITYDLASGQSLTIVPSFITQTLNEGTNVTLQATSDITLSSALSYHTGNLAFNAGGNIYLNANVTTGGADFTAIATSNLSLSDTASLQSATGDIDLTAGGSISLGGASLSTTSGHIEVHDAVVLTGSPTFSSTSGQILFDSTIDDSMTGANSLTLNAGTGSVTFSGDIGHTTPIGDLSVTAVQVNLPNAFTVASSADVTFDAPILADDLVSITSTGGSVTVSAITSVGDIHLQPSSTLLPNELSAGDLIPEGILVLKGALSAPGKTIELSIAGRSSLPSVATITGNPSGGNLTISAQNLNIGGTTGNELLTVFGDVAFTIDDTSLFGDIIGTGSVTISSLSNTIFLHLPGSIYSSSGTLYTDQNTNILATAAIPTIDGTIHTAGSGTTYDKLQVSFSQSEYEDLLVYAGYLLTSDLNPPLPPPTPASVSTFSTALFSQARLNYAQAIAESFTLWESCAFGPYLSDDSEPPVGTPKGLGQVLPSLEKPRN